MGEGVGNLEILFTSIVLDTDFFSGRVEDKIFYEGKSLRGSVVNSIGIVAD